MSEPYTTLPRFLDKIAQTPAAPLVFVAEGQTIKPNYHVTEIKLAQIAGLDCGKKQSQWTETLVQLLDGSDQESTPGAGFMTADEFKKIAHAGESNLRSFEEGELFFEFAPENRAMRKLAVNDVAVDENRIVVELGPVSAVCKPALRSAQSNCCSPSSGASDQPCCSSTQGNCCP